MIIVWFLPLIVKELHVPSLCIDLSSVFFFWCSLVSLGNHILKESEIFSSISYKSC